MEEKNYFCRGAFKNSILKELDSPGWKNRWHELEIKTLQQIVLVDYRIGNDLCAYYK